MRTTIDGFIDAALLIRPESMSQRACINDVRILRVNDNAADLACVFQPDMIPGCATVGGSVDAIT